MAVPVSPHCVSEKAHGLILLYERMQFVPIHSLSSINGVKEADVVIILTPQGRGTHTELGIALALNKQIYLCHSDRTFFCCDDNTSAFYWLPQVNQYVGSVDDLADMLIK